MLKVSVRKVFTQEKKMLAFTCLIENVDVIKIKHQYVTITREIYFNLEIDTPSSYVQNIYVMFPLTLRFNHKTG